MIIDVQRFIAREQLIWSELEEMLERFEERSVTGMKLEQLKRFHYLIERTSADLIQIRELVTQGELQHHLESLISCAYCEIQDMNTRRVRFRPLRWFIRTFPSVFRRHVCCFALSTALMLGGAVVGGCVIAFEPAAKEVILPFDHLMQSPSERVAEEESGPSSAEGLKGTFASQLMTHNTKVSIFTLGLGVTWGIGTVVLLFYNGVILGAVVADYLMAGEGAFLTGWLLPHGSIEIPAILIAGQAGLILAGTMIGGKGRNSLRVRLRAILPDLVTLIGGVAVMLVWAGVVESFFSQDHEPALPYALKIAVGCTELALLFSFLFLAGRRTKEVQD
ncbi:MAG: stage II sporulation protein M [Pontiellaceae bacterium]|nr:stage II sporulation protein M [Pontiellaceae bacterium]